MQGRPQYHPSVPGARFRPPQRRNQNYQLQQKNQKAFKVAVPQGKTDQGSSTGARAPVFGPCYNYNQPGHFAKYCPHPKKK
jgi:hypothetical protein